MQKPARKRRSTICYGTTDKIRNSSGGDDPGAEADVLKVYGIKSCDTCRRAKKYLDDNDIAFEFHDVRDEGLNIQTLERWADRLGWEKLVNRNSLTWRKIPEVDRNDISRARALALIIEYPTLLKRPVFEDDAFSAIGFSERRFTDFLKRSA